MSHLHQEIRDLIIVPTLADFGKGGFSFNKSACIDLVYGTALAETGLRDLEQERGPALGFWQMEPATHDDIWENYLKYDSALRTTLINVCALRDPYNYEPPNHPLIFNLRYGCAMCMIHYHRYLKTIPTDLKGQAEAWLKTYNRGGKGSIEHYLETWKNA